MDEWGTSDLQPTPGKASNHRTGGWCVSLSILSLLIGGSLTALMVWLSRDMPSRPIWIMGLIFMVPVAAVFAAAILLDGITNAMTPSTSRGDQLKVAAGAIAATFLIGCLCDGIYLYTDMSVDATDDVIFLLFEYDVSGNSDVDQATMEVIRTLKRQSAGTIHVGVYMYD